ncbi:MAG: hypothetical protein OQJ84_03135, partial [Xanthomonadales bacterium]|nr:hypothetical protein [Xanthomonadales bacterium]
MSHPEDVVLGARVCSVGGSHAAVDRHDGVVGTDLGTHATADAEGLVNVNAAFLLVDRRAAEIVDAVVAPCALAAAQAALGLGEDLFLGEAVVERLEVVTTFGPRPVIRMRLWRFGDVTRLVAVLAGDIIRRV